MEPPINLNTPSFNTTDEFVFFLVPTLRRGNAMFRRSASTHSHSHSPQSGCPVRSHAGAWERGEIA